MKKSDQNSGKTNRNVCEFQRSGKSLKKVQPLKQMVVLLFVALAFAMSNSVNAAIITSAGNGNWNQNGTWVGNVHPVAGDDVIIANGHTVTLTTTETANSLQVGQGVSGILIMGNNNSVRILTITGNVVIMGGGTIRPANPAQATAEVLNVGGTFDNSGTFTNTNGNGTIAVTLNGAIGQVIQGSSITSFLNLTLNNASGLSLSTSFSLSGTLTLTSGKITTNANKVSLTTAGTISGASATKYIIGDLELYIPNAAAPSKTFDIGDAGVYTPVTLAFTGTTTGSGSVTGSTTSADHADINNSGIDNTKSVNRYYTLTNNGVGGFTSYASTFNFVSADIDAAANTANFVVRKLDGGLWSTTTTGTKTATSTQATSLTLFSIYQIGEVNTLTVDVNPSLVTICVGNSASPTSSSTSVPTPSVKWQRDAGSGFIDIDAAIDGGVYSNFNTTTLNITGASLGMVGYIYRAVFTNINGAINSGTATMAVDAATVAGTVSADQIICEGLTMTDLTLAGHTGSVLKWQSSSDLAFTAPADISNTTTTLTGVAVGALTSTTYFRAVVQSGVCPSDNATPSAITVNPITRVTADPLTTTLCLLGNPSFAVTATGTNLIYAWMEDQGSGFNYLSDAGVYSNTTLPTMNITGATAGMNGYLYRCEVKGSCGLDQMSNSAALNISQPVVAATTAASICDGSSRTLYAAAGSALSFDGTNDYVEVGNNATLNAYPLTVSALVKTSDARPGNYGIITKYAPGSQNGYNVFMSGGHVYAFYFADNSNYCFDVVLGSFGLDGGLINDNAWHQIAFTVDATGAKLYVDGVIKDAQAWFGTPAACTTTEPLCFGRYGNGYFNGQMDELRVWNTGQNNSTLLTEMNVPVATPSANLNGYWRLDDGAGLTTADISGNGNKGTLKNGTLWLPSSSATINAGMTYEWSPATGLNGTVGVGVIASPVTDQIYTITGTDAYGCTSTTTTPVTIYTGPSVTLDPIPDVCTNASPFALSGGLPADGMYSGSGVAENIFNPAVWGAGNFSITYTYTDVNGCSNFATQPVTVAYTAPCVTTTELAAAYCNVVLTSLNDHLYFNWVSGATNYDINVVNAALGYDQTITVGSSTVFRMINFPGIAYGTTYDVKVKAFVSGVYGNYGSACQITTNACPVTQLATAYCGSTLVNMNDRLYFDYVAGASNYDINVMNAALGYNQTYTVGATTVFRMTNFAGIAYGTTYDVTVSPKINGVYGSYGSACTVTTPVGPTTQLTVGYCNITVVSLLDRIYFDWVAGASNYDIHISGVGIDFQQTITVGSSTVFRMYNFTGLLASTTYEVTVRAKINGVYCPYGTICLVATPAVLIRSESPDAVSIQTESVCGLSLNAYPNPFADQINVSVITSSDDMISINIYDITGRNIQSFANITKGKEMAVGMGLGKGIYMIEAIQGETRKLIRVVKL